MAIAAVVRAKLKGNDPKASQKIHDGVVGATQAMAQAAGNISHKVYLNTQNPRELLGIDIWNSAEAFQKFASDPKIQEFFGQLFEGQPEVTVWVDSGWKQW